MLKLVCLIVMFSSAYAQKTTYNFEARYVSFGGSPNGKTVKVWRNKNHDREISWLKEINENTSVSVIALVTYSPSNIMKSITIQNLCKPMDKSTSEGTIQGFILNLIAKSDKCPIKKGLKVTVPESFTPSFSAEPAKCGLVEITYQAYLDGAKLLSGKIRGTITGQSCENKNKQEIISINAHAHYHEG